jgi:hypothetical protein
MANGLSAAVFVILLIVSLAVAFGVALVSPPVGVVVFIAAFILSLLIAASIKVANQWERGLVLRLVALSACAGPACSF